MIATETMNPKVDAYLAKVQPFAEPIMEHLRELVHKACPEVEETIKWSRPFFEYRGVILCNMSAFKEHCTFGFWGEEIGAVLREAKALRPGGMGSLGRITSLKDLPSDKLMLGWIRQAAAFVDSGQYTSPIAARTRWRSRPNRPSRRPRSSPPRSREIKKPPLHLRRSAQLQTRVRRLDRRCQTPGDARQTDRDRGGVDRRGQAAELEISELLR